MHFFVYNINQGRRNRMKKEQKYEKYTKEALEDELQGGSSIPELDIRFDKDGKP